MSVKTLELTVLMPCLNEARTLARCITAAQNFICVSGIHGEVVVADNGSTDNSREIAAECGARVVCVAERGYGAALIAGISAAQGRYVIMGDADLSYDFSSLTAFVERLRAGADLVIGNRFQGGIEPGAMPFLHRYLGNPALSYIGRLFFSIPIGDFHCGLRGFRRNRFISLGLVTTGMEFASEMVAKAALAGLRIEQVPTTLRKDDRGRAPHLRTWRDGWRHLLFMLIFCPKWLFFLPGVALFAMGISGFALLTQGSLTLVSVNLGIHSLLYASAATILGLQLIQFAFLTKWIGVLSGIIPQPRWLAQAKDSLSVNQGIFLGFIFLLTGLLWSLKIFYEWDYGGYGALDPTKVMRSAIPAVTLMIVGIQSAATSLFAEALHFCWRSSLRRIAD